MAPGMNYEYEERGQMDIQQDRRLHNSKGDQREKETNMCMKDSVYNVYRQWKVTSKAMMLIVLQDHSIRGTKLQTRS